MVEKGEIEFGEVGFKFYAIRQTETEEMLDLQSKLKAKERWCRREGHVDAKPLYLANTWVSLCSDCSETIFNHFELIITKYANKFTQVKKK